MNQRYGSVMDRGAKGLSIVQHSPIEMELLWGGQTCETKYNTQYYRDEHIEIGTSSTYIGPHLV